MMRTTTGRQLVEVKSCCRAGRNVGCRIEDDGTLAIDLGGGVVESGGRVIKDGEALNNLLEEGGMDYRLNRTYLLMLSLQ